MTHLRRSAVELGDEIVEVVNLKQKIQGDTDVLEGRRTAMMEVAKMTENSMARILIADDHAMMRKGLRTVIEPHAGWEICGEATTGLEALEQTKLLQPDLLILDVSMPVLNGLEVAHRISRTLPNVKVLLFTMHNSPQFAKDVTKTGAHGYVCKSSGEELLTQAIKTVLQGESFFDNDGAQAKSLASGAF
jgi:DNA-binding NarL/FixJ family response regulator